MIETILHYFTTYVPIWPAIISFAFVTCLVLLALVYSRINWQVKTLMTIAALPVFVLAYMSIANSFGWPYKHSPQGRFQVLWADVHEPNPTKNDSGFILYWLKDFDLVSKTLALEPRVYSMPYTKDAHKTANEAKQQIADGKQVYGEKTNIKTEADSKNEGIPSSMSQLLQEALNAMGMGGDGEYFEDATDDAIKLVDPPPGLPYTKEE